MENNTDEKVMDALKDGEKSTTELSSIMGRNYYDAIEVLKKLANENKIVKISIGNYTYWRLNINEKV